MTETCPNRQRHILRITDKILQHAVGLLDLAGELDGLGCTCGLTAAHQPYRHAAACPIHMAWCARQMAMARSTCKAQAPALASKDVRPLAEPFRSP